VTWLRSDPIGTGDARVLFVAICESLTSRGKIILAAVGVTELTQMPFSSATLCEMSSHSREIRWCRGDSYVLPSLTKKSPRQIFD
jgi:hypothetical protein